MAVGKNENGEIVIKPRTDLRNAKKGLFDGFLSGFIKTDSKTLGEWFAKDVFVPGLQNLILNTLAKLFFGNDGGYYTGGGSSSRRGTREYTDYGRYSYRGSVATRDQSRKEAANRYQEDLVNEGDIPDYRRLPPMPYDAAVGILEDLRGIIRDTENGVATVGQLYTLGSFYGWDSQWSNWGWDEEAFKPATKRKGPRDLWYLVIPDAIYLGK